MALEKAPQAPDAKEYANIGDFIGSDIAIRKTDTKMVDTEHGEQRVYIVDIVSLSGNVETGVYCFWRDVQRQLDNSTDWIAGRLVKEDHGRFTRHVLEPDNITKENIKVLSEAIDKLDEVPF